MWLKWNQPRIDYNEAALDAIGQEVTRPINDWCPEADEAGRGRDLRRRLRPPAPTSPRAGTTGARSTPRCTTSTSASTRRRSRCARQRPPRRAAAAPASRQIQNVVQESTFEYVVANRDEMLHDELEIYRRGDVDAPRPECCPDPFKPEFHNWMLDYPQAYVIPVGKGQRSDAEANRLVEWALFNDIEVDELERDYRVGAQTFEEGSYVIWMAQPRRGLADTALSIGVDISPRIQRLYAPPAAWSHGYLWGADTVTIPDGARFSPRTDRIHRPNRLKGLGARRQGRGLHAEVDSPTAVRALNALVRGGAKASLATAAFSGGPAGTAVFGTDKATKRALEDAAERLRARLRQALVGLAADARADRARAADPRDQRARQCADRQHGSDAAVDQSVWVLRQLGFDADPMSTSRSSTRRATDPLAGYDLIYNAASNYPAEQRSQRAVARPARRVLRGRRRLHRRPARTARTS